MQTWISVMSLCLGLSVTSVFGQSAVWYDWEDGKMHGSRTSMRVPPKILEAPPTKFLRITGSATDKDSIPSGLPSPWNRMNRSLVTMTYNYRNMPKVTAANQRQTYSARIRYVLPKAQSVNIFELFQNAPGGGGYNPTHGPKNLVRFQVGSVGKANGRLYFESRFDMGTRDEIKRYDLGYVPPNTWNNYMIRAVYSHDPRIGRFEGYLNGKRVVTIAGRSTFSSPRASQLPMVKFGAYGIDGVGTIDVDNVLIDGSAGVVHPIDPCEEITPRENLRLRTASGRIRP